MITVIENGVSDDACENANDTLLLFGGFLVYWNLFWDNDVCLKI